MTDTHLGLRISEALDDAISEMAHESRTSKSEVARQSLRDALLDLDGEIEIPAHLRKELERERLKRRNRLKWQRIHFPSNVAERFRRAFEQGDLDGDLNPGAVDDIREIFVEDAEVLFDDADRRRSAIEFVESLAARAEDAESASEFDRLDPEEMFEQYSGVEDGRSRSDLDDVVEDALDRLRGSIHARDPAALAQSLAKRHEVSEELASEAVDRALSEVLDDGEGST